MRPRRAAPIRLGLLLGISRGGATGFSLICIEKEWLGNPHSFVKISGGRSIILFCLPFHAGSSASLDSWRTAGQSSQEETEYRDKRGSQVKCNLGKMCCLWGTTRNCFILCYQDWWTKDDHGPTVRDLSLFFQLFSETSIHLDSWLMIICHAYLEPMFICCSPQETVDLLSYSMVAHQLQHVRIDCLLGRNQHLMPAVEICQSKFRSAGK